MVVRFNFTPGDRSICLGPSQMVLVGGGILDELQHDFLDLPDRRL